jgi:hypothetical protein
MAAFPQVAEVTLITAPDPNSGNDEVGYVKLYLTPGSADVVDSSSPMQYTLSPNALVVVASGPTG